MALRQKSPNAEEQSDGEARGDGLPERPVPDRDEVEGRLPGESGHDAFFKGVGHIRAWLMRSGGGEQFLVEFGEVHSRSIPSDAIIGTRVTDIFRAPVFPGIFASRRGRGTREFSRPAPTSRS